MAFRCFQLITDGHSDTSAYKLRKIRVESVVREASHLAASAIAHCQCDAENLRSFFSVLIIAFIEITATEEEERIRMFPLQFLVLRDKGIIGRANQLLFRSSL